ncbi:hypothetical protein ACOMHN_059938 [Nucella lapillus]
MSWFGAFRSEHGFTWYGDNRTAVRFDFTLVAVTYLCVVVAVATLISTLGIRGRERWASTLRASYAVGIASIILVCLVGHDWLVGQTEAMTHYLYRSDNYFRGTVGLRIALHGCNVTLEGYYTGVNGEGHVYYDEAMKWKDFGHEPETINHYLHRGLPHPVLTVMDFLSADGGGLRWGRSYHSAGYFANALLWTAFAFWIICNVLLMSVVSYGAFMFFLTGVAMVLCCVVYHVCMPPHPLRIHFGDSVLTVCYGWCFWLLLAAGILTLVLGAAMFVCDHIFHEKVAEFFNLENLDEDDLPDFGHYDIKNPDKKSSFSAPFNGSTGGSRTGSTHKLTVHDFGRSSSDHRGSNLLLAGPQGDRPRRGSIFLEPERKSSDQAGRRSSLQPGMLSGGPGGITNKGFEQERPLIKTNPLFDPAAVSTIASETQGEEGDRGRMREVKEHRENHINERQQQQSHNYVIGGGGGEVVTCTAVVIEAPSDDDDGHDDVMEDLQTRRQPTKNQEPEVCKGHESGSDSAIASGAPSPSDSAKNSTCSDSEDTGL